MKLFSVFIIITSVFTAKSQITLTQPYEPPPAPPPLECQPQRKLTLDNSPWIPGLYFLQNSGKKERVECAVSQIADRVVITRAECVPEYTEETEERNGVIVEIRKKEEYFLRPTGSIDEDDFRLVIKREENKTYDLALLYVARPICADNVCWPPKQDFYEWSHCFVVGNHRIPQVKVANKDMVQLDAPEEREEDDTSFPCEIHYNINLGSGMTKSDEEWSNYTSDKSIIHVKGKENMGTCMWNRTHVLGEPITPLPPRPGSPCRRTFVENNGDVSISGTVVEFVLRLPGSLMKSIVPVNSGSPMMCATKSSPNRYFQAGVVVERTVFDAEDNYNCENLDNLCIIGNFSQILQSCPELDYNTAIDACNGFDIVNTRKDEIKNWIDETINNWEKSESPPAWKPICKDRGAVDVQYNEFPWMAAIFKSRGKSSSSRGTFIGAATVIHPQMALTSRLYIEKYHITQLYLLTGVRNLDHVREYGSDGEHERRRELVGFEPMSRNEDEDMVIIYWDEPLENVDFPQLPQKGEHFHNKICLTLGWGLHSHVPDDDEPAYHATLKKAEVPTYDSYECHIKLQRSVYPDLSPGDLFGYICAGGKHSTDVCLVDQGGPLVCQREDHTLVLVGIMYYAPGCNKTDTPNLYSSIATYINKIIPLMGSIINSANPYYYSDNTESNDLLLP